MSRKIFSGNASGYGDIIKYCSTDSAVVKERSEDFKQDVVIKRLQTGESSPFFIAIRTGNEKDGKEFMLSDDVVKALVSLYEKTKEPDILKREFAFQRTSEEKRYIMERPDVATEIIKENDYTYQSYNKDTISFYTTNDGTKAIYVKLNNRGVFTGYNTIFPLNDDVINFFSRAIEWGHGIFGLDSLNSQMHDMLIMRVERYVLVIECLLENHYLGKGIFVLDMEQLQTIINWYKGIDSEDGESSSDTYHANIAEKTELSKSNDLLYTNQRGNALHFYKCDNGQKFLTLRIPNDCVQKDFLITNEILKFLSDGLVKDILAPIHITDHVDKSTELTLGIDGFSLTLDYTNEVGIRREVFILMKKEIGEILSYFDYERED